MCRTCVAWHQGLTAQVFVVGVLKSFPFMSHERAFLIPNFTSPSLLSCTSCPTSPAPLSDNPATIHDQEGTACPPGRTTSHNVRCTELTLTVQRADGCYVPVDGDGDATFFLHIGTEMEAAFVVDGTPPDPENTTNPYFMRFAVDHGFDLPCKCLVEETTTGVLKPKGLVPS